MFTKHKWTDDQLRAAVAASLSVAQVLRALRMRVAGGNYKTVQRRIADLKLDTAHWLGMANLRGKTHNWSKARPLESLLQRGSRYGSYYLKLRLIGSKVLQPVCDQCKLTQWLDKPIPLELDHIDGDGENNVLSNLRLLCPNCHALTTTYRAKNTRYPNIPSLQEIMKGIEEAGGIPQYARSLGVDRGRIYWWLKSERLRRISKVEESRAQYLQ
jgi:hypothetical protein